VYQQTAKPSDQYRTLWNKTSEKCTLRKYIKYTKWYTQQSSGQNSWLHNRDALWFLWGTNWIYICVGKGIDVWYSSHINNCSCWSGTTLYWKHRITTDNWSLVMYTTPQIYKVDTLCGRFGGQSSWLHNTDVRLRFLWGTNWV
jgi:hypothetical protein